MQRNPGRTPKQPAVWHGGSVTTMSGGNEMWNGFQTWSDQTSKKYTVSAAPVIPVCFKSCFFNAANSCENNIEGGHALVDG
mmetsp:Transcript_3224/g.7975  ORF Transcript_3224/g.7975 Transcript_3224/m.7975 type:complete len:81 (-) Transcript_3224:62-304(-)